MGDKFQYVKLPNGEYGKFAADAPDDLIRSTIAKDFPDAFAQPNAGLAAPKDNSKAKVSGMDPVNRGLLTGMLEAGDTLKGVAESAIPGAASTVSHINDIRKMGLKGWWNVNKARDAEQQARPVADRLGEAVGVNVEDLKQNIESGNLAGAAANTGAAVARVLVPAKLMKRPITTKEQVSSASSTLTHNARTSIPEAMTDTLPALKVEAAELGIKPKDMNIGNFRRVTDGLDTKLEKSFQDVKANASPSQANIPGQSLADAAIDRVNKAFPWLQKARPQAHQDIIAQLRQKFGSRNWSIDELDAERRALNSESAGSMSQKQVTREVATKDPQMASEIHAAEAVRDILYDEIGRRTGEDMQGLKMQQSRLATLRRQLKVQETELPNNQAKVEGQPFIEGVVDAHGPWDATKKATTGKYLEPERKTNRRLRKAFEDKVSRPPAISYGIGPSTQERR